MCAHPQWQVTIKTGPGSSTFMIKIDIREQFIIWVPALHLCHRPNNSSAHPSILGSFYLLCCIRKCPLNSRKAIIVSLHRRRSAESKTVILLSVFGIENNNYCENECEFVLHMLQHRRVKLELCIWKKQLEQYFSSGTFIWPWTLPVTIAVLKCREKRWLSSQILMHRYRYATLKMELSAGHICSICSQMKCTVSWQPGKQANIWNLSWNIALVDQITDREQTGHLFC